MMAIAASTRSLAMSCITHVVAGQRDDMGDAAAHLARADDADLADGSHFSLALRGRIGAEPEP